MEVLDRPTLLPWLGKATRTQRLTKSNCLLRIQKEVVYVFACWAGAAWAARGCSRSSLIVKVGGGVTQCAGLMLTACISTVQLGLDCLAMLLQSFNDSLCMGSVGMGSPFVSSGIGALDSLGFMSRSAKRREQVWENLHVSPRTAPSKGAKLCTYHRWFGRPSTLRFEPYYELPMGASVSSGL